MKERNPQSPPLALIKRSILGDQEAFEQIFNAYKNLVYKTAFLMLGNREDAEDMLQSVFLQVYKSLDTYDSSKAAFTTWLYRITTNKCINHRRKMRFRFLSFNARLENTLVSQGREEKQIENEQMIDHALSNLSDKLRAVIVLRYYWEMSYAEIAQSLEIPLGTVKSRLSQALTKLDPLVDSSTEHQYEEIAK